MATDDLRGRFVWHELMTDDPEAAKAFYPKVVSSWRGQPWEKDSSYTLWVTSRGMSGGLMQLPPDMKGVSPAWLNYIGTPDVAATVAEARRLGATVVKDT